MAGEPDLTADIRLELGSLDLAALLTVGAGTVTAVLGPNGAGKTTILRCLAGLSGVDRGSIRLGSTVLDDAQRRVFLAPEARGVGVVFQDYLLFPHLTAADNIAFGLRAAGRNRSEAREEAGTWLERFGLSDHARVKPRHLSGGQAQRVALARALAPSPDLLLLDEPLAALDAGTRIEVRRDLRRHLADYGGATVLVTHDPIDALTLADDVVILEHGKVTQSGRLHEVTTRPRSPYVASLIGTNLLTGTGRNGVVDVDGTAVVTVGAVDGPVFVTFSPAAVSLYRDPPGGSPRNHWPMRVTGLDLLGERVRVHLTGVIDLVAEVTPAAVSELGLVEGDDVVAAVKATEVTTYAM